MQAALIFSFSLSALLSLLTPFSTTCCFLSPSFSLPTFCFLVHKFTLFVLASWMHGCLALGPWEPAPASLPCSSWQAVFLARWWSLSRYGIGTFSANSFASSA